jgi:hypothetical protein
MLCADEKNEEHNSSVRTESGSLLIKANVCLISDPIRDVNNFLIQLFLLHLDQNQAVC